MSFLVFISQQHKRRINQKKQEISFLRKEEDSAMTQSISSFPKDEERASLFASFQGSVSVEAALVLPIFFSGSMLSLLSVGNHVRTVLCSRCAT